ncbi:glycerate kinase [Echinicola jeungdonensis]|uniref:Glycerate kinase n=1 Tax=Echinicola jeungdonensis TaxID=709343 RepID=A0ABV5J657_9BACT|nr:glycerate kinase [Echinicola jeungdonensis]MDN3668026.1 glycerate kinase [Echinicola jeungdonensis]
MKILVAPNAFKGTIEADQAAIIIQKAIESAIPDAQTNLAPIADGGDGTCDLLASSLCVQSLEIIALNAIGKPVTGKVYFDTGKKVAYLDVSTVSGIKWLEAYERDAKVTSSYGTGELIKKLSELGINHIVLGLGGSASVDMGTGILRALGFLFLDQNGREIPQFSLGFLSRIAHIQRPPRNYKLSFTCLCDVNNYFFGEKGAIPVFGPQKGLLEDDLKEFEKGSIRVFELLKKKSIRKLADQPGFGAAGGIALGLSAFFPVEVFPGATYFFEQVHMEAKIKEADLVITGEGHFDAQSAAGKGPFELLQLAKKCNKKTILITSGEEGKESGFYKVITLPALKEGQGNIKKEAENNLEQKVKAFFKGGHSKKIECQNKN